MFEKAKQGDKLAQNCINDMVHWLSLEVYNLITSFNPDRLLIGGGISIRDDFLEMIRNRVGTLLKQKGATVTTDIDRCRFCNASNLIGAVAQFLSEYPTLLAIK
nr:ROK family protein [Secundilactobacillus silagei]